MGEAFIFGGGGGVKVAEGFPKALFNYGSIGSSVTIPDLVGCNGFAMFILSDDVSKNDTVPSGLKFTVSVFYDGTNLIYSRVIGASNVSVGYRTGEFNVTTGEIDLGSDYYFGNSYTMQCIYW